MRFHSYGIQISRRVEFSDDLTVHVMLNQDEVFVMVLCKSVDETFVLLVFILVSPFGKVIFYFFFRNSRSCHFCHWCGTSNGNKLEIVANQMDLNTSLDFLRTY